MAEKVCPVWVGYFLANPLRKLYHNPDKILNPYIKEGMKIIDIGSAMGFFSIPAAKIVGKNGKVICIDLQKRMLEKLKVKADKFDLLERIELLNCSAGSLGINKYNNQIDFALAFAVLHEMPDLNVIFKEVYAALKINAKMLVAEPAGHVTEEGFYKTVETAVGNNFKVIDHPKINGSKAALLEKI